MLYFRDKTAKPSDLMNSCAVGHADPLSSLHTHDKEYEAAHDADLLKNRPVTSSLEEFCWSYKKVHTLQLFLRQRSMACAWLGGRLSEAVAP